MPGGRPPKFSRAVADALVKAARAGLPQPFAAASAGVSATSLRRYLVAGRTAKRGEYREFWRRWQDAQATFVRLNLALILKAGRKGNWKAAAWALEHLYPDTFAANARELAELRREVKRLAELIGQTSDGRPPAPPPGAGPDRPGRAAPPGADAGGRAPPPADQ